MSVNRQFDHVTLCSPSGALTDEVRLDRAIEVLGHYRLPIVEQLNTRSRLERFAGSDSERLHALQMACGMSQASLILATRGGYGLTRLLDEIDLPALAERMNRYQHLLCGHSDLTVLQLALLQAGAKPETLLHGAMACFDFGAEGGADATTLAHFNRAVFEGQVAVQWNAVTSSSDNDLAGASDTHDVIYGPVWGGNLAMICSLLGTPWQPMIQSGILILEDVGEPTYKIERMLLQLKQSGILSRQNAVVLGDFGPESCNPHDNGFTLDSVITYLRQKLSVPVLSGFPFGHVTPKACWFQGANGQIVRQANHDVANANQINYLFTQSLLLD